MGMGKSNAKAVVNNKRTEASQAAGSSELADAMKTPDITDDLVKKAARGGLSKLRSGYGRKGTFLVGDAFGNTLGG